MQKLLVSLIIPCYNEEQVLGILYKAMDEVTKITPEYDYEFIFVNDGSKDKTLSIIKNFSEKDIRARFISFSRNFGKEAAIYAGLTASKGDLVTIMDADMQDPPSLIPEMINAIINEGYDSAATRRVSRDGEPPVRSFFAKLFYKLINKMSGLTVMDGARDFRMMKRKMVDAIVSMQEYHRFSKGIFDWVGFNTKWLEYKNIERAAGETKWSFFKLFKYALEGIISFTTLPLKFATFFGFFVSLAAFVYLLYTFINFFVGGPQPAGYPSLMVTILFLGGIQLITIGILGEYVARNYMESKKRPVYIIKETEDDLKK